MKKLNEIAFFVLLAFIFLSISIIPHIMDMPNLYLLDRKVVNFSDGWAWKGDGYEKKYSLPYHFDVENSEPLVIRNTIPDDLPDGSVFATRSVAHSVVVKIDGETIYEMGNDREKYLGRDLGTFWAFIKTEPEHKGKEIEISLFSYRTVSHGFASEVFIGSESALYAHLFMQNGLWNIFSPVIISLGLFIIFAYFVFGIYKEKNRAILYLGFFAFIMGNWFLGESQMLQLITKNTYYTVRITHLMTLLAPITACLFIREIVPMKKRFLDDFLVTLAIVNAVVTLGLEYFDILGLTDTIDMTMVLIVLISVYYLGILLMETLLYKNEKAFRELKLLSIVFVSGIVEIAVYYINGQLVTSHFLHIGVLVYVILMLISQFKDYMDRKRIREEREYYAKMAYTDILTGGYNRARYMEDMEKITEPGGVVIVQVDTDRLKYINDSFGHSAGDLAIIDTYQIVEANFAHVGNTYRIGGDEFAVIVKNTATTEEVDTIIEKVKKDVELKDKEREYTFSISLGFAEYEASLDEDIYATAVRADHKMYEDKRRLKNV
ncbi:MAG: diguanylate cyclase [Christensenellales bacterium]|jgi:diguanylate cyclase (GGDEF)-like protein|nr:diguanylate cyclase [Christensenellaceae bacterium]